MNRPVRVDVEGLPVLLSRPGTVEPDPGGAAHQQPLPWLERPTAGAEPAGLWSDPHAQQVQRLVHGVAARLLEVLQGRRGDGQLAGWVSEAARLVLGAWARQQEWRATRIGSVRASRTQPRVVEGWVHLVRGRPGGDELHFCAVMRLEHGNGRWVVTLVEVLLPPAALAA